MKSLYYAYIVVPISPGLQGVLLEDVRPDYSSATEIFHAETPSSVQVYQVKLWIWNTSYNSPPVKKKTVNICWVLPTK